jgi:hypothetical protein
MLGWQLLGLARISTIILSSDAAFEIEAMKVLPKTPKAVMSRRTPKPDAELVASWVECAVSPQPDIPLQHFSKWLPLPRPEQRGVHGLEEAVADHFPIREPQRRPDAQKVEDRQQDQDNSADDKHGPPSV